MEPLEELTPEMVARLTRTEARDLIEQRKTIIEKLKHEVNLLTPVAYPNDVPKKCRICGSRLLITMPKGGYLCRDCGFRHSVSEIIVGS